VNPIYLSDKEDSSKLADIIISATFEESSFFKQKSTRLTTTLHFKELLKLSK
jgi:hypothetical protein